MNCTRFDMDFVLDNSLTLLVGARTISIVRVCIIGDDNDGNVDTHYGIQIRCLVLSHTDELFSVFR